MAAPGRGDLSTLEHLGAYDAVRLFLERAGEARPNLRLGEAAFVHVAAICARLNGNPWHSNWPRAYPQPRAWSGRRPLGARLDRRDLRWLSGSWWHQQLLCGRFSWPDDSHGALKSCWLKASVFINAAGVSLARGNVRRIMAMTLLSPSPLTGLILSGYRLAFMVISESIPRPGNNSDWPMWYSVWLQRARAFELHLPRQSGCWACHFFT